jgi:hypothetical protein
MTPVYIDFSFTNYLPNLALGHIFVPIFYLKKYKKWDVRNQVRLDYHVLFHPSGQNTSSFNLNDPM